MDNPVDLISHMQDFCGFLAELNDVRPDVLLAPIAEGKWSVQEIVAHIMTYDEVFLQSVVIPIEDGRQPNVPDAADNQSFNEKAAELGRKITKRQLLERATLSRRQLLDHLQRLPAKAFQTKQVGRVDVDLCKLLDNDFVSHDRIHIEQMRTFLESCERNDVAYSESRSSVAGKSWELKQKRRPCEDVAGKCRFVLQRTGSFGPYSSRNLRGFGA